ncbi:hypothetical protein HW132_33935 [Brasilonema sp. CT11]|nr:hypothetical protein [Brasilonema sp. CT11]
MNKDQVLGFVPQTPDTYGGKPSCSAGSPTYRYYKCLSEPDISPDLEEKRAIAYKFDFA